MKLRLEMTSGSFEVAKSRQNDAADVPPSALRSEW